MKWLLTKLYHLTGSTLYWRYLPLTWRVKTARDVLIKNRVPMDVLFRSGSNMSAKDFDDLQTMCSAMGVERMAILYRWLESCMQSRKTTDPDAARYLAERGL